MCDEGCLIVCVVVFCWLEWYLELGCCFGKGEVVGKYFDDVVRLVVDFDFLIDGVLVVELVVLEFF